LKHPRKKKVRGKDGHPRIVGIGLTEDNSLPSLPPEVVGAALAVSPPTPVKGSPEDTRVACPTCKTLTKRPTCPNGHPVEQPDWRLPDNSILRERAMKILALRLGGMSDEEIAKYLNITRSTISPTLWRAGKNGWLAYNSTREAIENGLMHKVIRNLDEALDDETRNEKTGMTVKAQMALKVAEGTAFKEFGSDTTMALPNQTAISIRIEQPSVQQPMREGTIGGQVIDVLVPD
jgi:hypothetical protein